jgi:hypothetical protein
MAIDENFYQLEIQLFLWFSLPSSAPSSSSLDHIQSTVPQLFASPTGLRKDPLEMIVFLANTLATWEFPSRRSLHNVNKMVFIRFQLFQLASMR